MPAVPEFKKAITTQLKIDKFKDKSSRSFMVLVDGMNRVDLLKKIEKMFEPFGAKYDPNKGSSSVGAVVIGNISIGASPASKQGKRSAGLDNEDTLIDNINMFVKNGPMNIVFKGKNKTFVVNDVIKAQEMGRDTSGRKKSDVNLITKNGKVVPLSLKKDGAEMWESADTYYAAEAKKIIDDLILKGKVVLSKGAIKKLTPNVAIKASTQEAKNVVFGSDIERLKGAVLYKTFSASDFKVNADGNLEIDITKIYTNIGEVERGDHAVYFLLRNDSSRRGSKIYPGIRALAVGKTRINKNVLIVK
jgi:hypothetical protein